MTFTLDGTSTGCTLSGGVVSFTAVGTCVVDANQAGNANCNAAPQVQQSITVNKGNQTITFTSTNPSPVTVGGATYTPTATATSGLTVTFTLDGTSTGCTLGGGVVSFTAVGTCVVDANQAGNANYNAAPQVQQSFTVNKGNQTIIVHLDEPLAGDRRWRHLHPDGHGDVGLAVTFTLDGTSTGCTLSGGVVSFTAAGTCVVDANQAGNANYNAAPQVQQSITVNKGNQTITFTSTRAGQRHRRRRHLHRGRHRHLRAHGDVHLGIGRCLHLRRDQRLGLHLRRRRHLHRRRQPGRQRQLQRGAPGPADLHGRRATRPSPSPRRRQPTRPSLAPPTPRPPPPPPD